MVRDAIVHLPTVVLDEAAVDGVPEMAEAGADYVNRISRGVQAQLFRLMVKCARRTYQVSLNFGTILATTMN